MKRSYLQQKYIKLYRFYIFPVSSDTKDYALKQIEGTGISMSACREVAVRTFGLQ